MPISSMQSLGEHSPPFTFAKSYAASEGYIAFGDADARMELKAYHVIMVSSMSLSQLKLMVKDAPTRCT